MDLMFANSSNGIKYEKRPVTILLNVGTVQDPLFKPPFEIPGITGVKPSATFGDVDGDGIFDMVIASYLGRDGMYFHKNIGTNDNPDFETNGIPIKFKGIPITKRFFDTRLYQDKKDEIKPLLETEEYWSYAAKAVANVTLCDYNNDGEMDLLLGIFGLCIAGEFAGYPIHGSMLLAFSNLKIDVSNIETSDLENKINSSFLVRDGNLTIRNIPYRDQYTLKLYSIMGALLYSTPVQKSGENSVQFNLKNNSFAKGIKLIVIPEIGFREIITF